jgi:hypothetical protein
VWIVLRNLRLGYGMRIFVVWIFGVVFFYLVLSGCLFAQNMNFSGNNSTRVNQGLNFSKSSLTSNNQDSELKLTAPILQNTLYAKTESEREYCERVIEAAKSGILPKKILYYTYSNSITKDRNQRFIRFQMALEHICKKEKIDLKSDKVKKNESHRNFFLFAIPRMKW